MQQRRDDSAEDFAGKTNFDTYFGNLKQGVNFKQPDLAAVLTRIANQGAKDFYDGKTADLIAASMRDGSMPHEARSMSTNTGMALCCNTAIAVATNE